MRLLLLAALPPLLLGCAWRSSATPLAPGETVHGTLAEGDTVLAGGEWADVYAMNVHAGQRLSIRHEAEEFDCYLLWIDPSGRQIDNDDFGGELHSQIDVTAERSGTAKIIPTAYRPGEGGEYTLSVVSPDL